MEDAYELQERKGPNGAACVGSLYGSDHLSLDVASTDLVQRRLKQRHVQMIAIAGTMGTGLFLGAGTAISMAGPFGALIAFVLVGSVAYSSLCSLGEMTCLAPVSGTFPHFASRWVDPAFGFAVGWNYFITLALYLPVEVSGARILIALWDSDKDHAAVYTVIICILMCSTNIFGVAYFGETEFIFSIIKLTMITGLIIVGLLIDLGGLPGQDALGFKYWKNPGVFLALQSQAVHPALDRFLGILAAIVQAAFAYQGMEVVAIAASETMNPRRNIAKAVRRVFARIFTFYILGVFVAGLIVASNNRYLSGNSGSSTQSPFVIAMTTAGIKLLPAVVNAGMITSAFSAGNTFLFCSSRILYGLALRGQAPHFLTFCTKQGLPIVAVLCSCSFVFLSLIDLKSGAEKVFSLFVQISAVGGFFGWLSINLTYIFFYRGLRYQRIDRTKLHYWNPLQPWLSIWGIIWCALFILINGYSTFWKLNWNSDPLMFWMSYLDIPLFLGLFLFWKITRKSVLWKLDEMDFTTGIPTPEETEGPEIVPEGFWQHLAAALF